MNFFSNKDIYNIIFSQYINNTKDILKTRLVSYNFNKKV